MDTVIIISESDIRRIIREVIREEIGSLKVDSPNPSENEEALMTREEMAKFLRISLVTLTDWVKRGLPCIKKGGRVLFQKAEVMAAIKGRPVKNKPDRK